MCSIVLIRLIRGCFRWLWPRRSRPSIWVLRLSDFSRVGWIKYDLYAYFEDDLVILDPSFFAKLTGFAHKQEMNALFSHRVELATDPTLWIAFLSTAPCRSQTYVRSFRNLKLLLERNGREALSLFRIAAQPSLRLFRPEWYSDASLDSSSPTGRTVTAHGSPHLKVQRPSVLPKLSGCLSQ